MYGYGTHSHINSTEYRQLKKERAEFTKKYEAGEVAFETVEIPLTCRCPQRPYPHELSVHASLRTDWAAYGNGKPKNSWPWSLRFIEESS